jgi:hypothetical protein
VITLERWMVAHITRAATGLVAALGLATRAPPPVAKLIAPTIEFDELAQTDHSPVGVLLLSVGAPETPEDVEQYLYNVFTSRGHLNARSPGRSPAPAPTPRYSR